jgi:hypothetical protein
MAPTAGARVRCRVSGRLASENRHLIAQHDDLDRDVRALATGEPDQLEDATEHPVQERQGRRRVLAALGADVKVQFTAHG